MNEIKHYTRSYYTSREISLHITLEDLWVSLFGKVLDLSPLGKDMIHRDHKEIFPLLTFAGKDISHLFDESGEVKIHIDPNTNKISPFLPFLSFPGVTQERAEDLFWHRRAINEKMSEALMLKYRGQKLGLNNNPPSMTELFSTNEDLNEKELPWWKDDKYVIGYLTKKPRWIKVLNTMIMKEVVLEVCSEDSIERILERYLKFNRHARSYTWKYLGEGLVMEQTLEMNGIPDQNEELDRLKMNSDDFIPTLTLYFNHDLTDM